MIEHWKSGDIVKVRGYLSPLTFKKVDIKGRIVLLDRDKNIKLFEKYQIVNLYNSTSYQRRWETLSGIK